MAGFEVSDAPAHVNNPFQIIGTLADVQNKFNQNKLFQAKALAGEYLTQSLGPNGQPDPDKFSTMLKGDRRTAPYAPEILNDMQVIRKGGIGASQEQQNLAQSGLNNLRQITAAYGTSSKTGDEKENILNATTAITKLMKSGIFSPEQAAEYIGSGNLTADIRAAVISGAGGEGAQTALTGKPTQVNTGGAIKTVGVNPYTNEANPMGGEAASIPTTLTPGEKASRAPYVDPETGQPNSAPQSVLSTDTGEPAEGIAGISGPHGELPTGLVPGKGEALTSVAKNASDQMNELHTTYNGSTQREALLKEMLATQGEFRSGPGASKWSGFVTEANRILGTHFSPQRHSEPASL
jgi:hypothetical protein